MTPEAIDKVRKMRESGLSVKQICNALRVSRYWVEKACEGIESKRIQPATIASVDYDVRFPLPAFHPLSWGLLLKNTPSILEEI